MTWIAFLSSVLVSLIKIVLNHLSFCRDTALGRESLDILGELHALSVSSRNIKQDVFLVNVLRGSKMTALYGHRRATHSIAIKTTTNVNEREVSKTTSWSTICYDVDKARHIWSCHWWERWTGCGGASCRCEKPAPVFVDSAPLLVLFHVRMPPQKLLRESIYLRGSLVHWSNEHERQTSPHEVVANAHCILLTYRWKESDI